MRKTSPHTSHTACHDQRPSHRQRHTHSSSHGLAVRPTASCSTLPSNRRSSRYVVYCSPKVWARSWAGKPTACASVACTGHTEVHSFPVVMGRPVRQAIDASFLASSTRLQTRPSPPVPTSTSAYSVLALPTHVLPGFGITSHTVTPATPPCIALPTPSPGGSNGYFTHSPHTCLQ